MALSDTPIGTSANVVDPYLMCEGSLLDLGRLELAWAGEPSAVVGIAFLVLVGARLRPDGGGTRLAFDDPRAYTVEMTVDGGGPLVGVTSERAGLRHLSGPFLIEAAVSDASPLLGPTVRERRGRDRDDAVVIGLARPGRRLDGRLGNVRLSVGGTLRREARPAFAERMRHARGYYLVGSIHDSTRPRFDRAVRAAAAPVFALCIAFEVAATRGASPIPFALTVMMVASASFATPIGYPTNLMVSGHGGCRFGDFVHVGRPRTTATTAVAIFVIHRAWPS